MSKFITFSILFFLFIIGCSEDSVKNTTDNKTVKIAALLDFSSNNSQFGLEAKQAMELLKSQNSNLQISYYDVKSDNTIADSVLNYIISSGERPVIVTLTSWVSNYLANKIAENGMLQITIGSSAFNYSNLNSSIKMTESVANESKYLLEQLKSYDRIAIIHLNNDLGTTWNSTLKNSLGGKIVASEEFADTQTDFSAALTSIKNANPDVIVIASTKEGALIAKQAKSLGITVQCFGIRPILTNILLTEAACEGLIFTYPQIDYSKSLLSEFQTTYGYKAGSFGSESFDLVNILLNANKAGKTTPAEILSWLKNSAYSGCLGAITFDENCSASYKFTCMKVKNGSFEEVK